MTMKIIRTVVFSCGEGGGNPCPVALEADSLSDAAMQEEARSWGSEGTFVLKPTRPDCAVRFRYFAPQKELELCGHGTIGALWTLAREGMLESRDLNIETALGPVSAHWADGPEGLTVSVDQFLPQYREKVPSRDELCRALNITPDDLAPLPALNMATSRFKLLVPLKSEAVLHGLRPDFPYLWKICDACGTSGFYPFAPAADGEAFAFHARQFPNNVGYNEDPATGVAASPLGVYAALHGLAPVREGWNRFTVYQGFAMGRPCRLLSDVCLKDGAVTGTRIAGSAEYLCEGVSL